MNPFNGEVPGSAALLLLLLLVGAAPAASQAPSDAAPDWSEPEPSFGVSLLFGQWSTGSNVWPLVSGAVAYSRGGSVVWEGGWSGVSRDAILCYPACEERRQWIHMVTAAVQWERRSSRFRPYLGVGGGMTMYVNPGAVAFGQVGLRVELFEAVGLRGQGGTDFFTDGPGVGLRWEAGGYARFP